MPFALGMVAGAGERGTLLEMLKASNDPEIREAIKQAIVSVLTRAAKRDEQAAWLLGEMKSAQHPRDHY